MAPQATKQDTDMVASETSSRRLVINWMEFENFKSYAGVQKVGPFHQSFSAVVGANGSGKSNVIDGMQFVFGRRASKLRLSKVSELIHNSENFPNLQHARVSVYFSEILDKGGDEFEVLPNSELVISREAYRNNQSKYFINNKGSSMTEVTTMLKDFGVDLDNNRFLILQGEVEQISMMKPKAPNEHEDGLLEYIEDIVGSNKYIEPIDEKTKELEGLNDQRSEKLNRVKVAEKERDSLKGAKVEAEQYRSAQGEHCILRGKLYQVFMYESRQIVEEVEQKQVELTKKLEYEQEKSKKFEAEVESMKKDYEKERESHDQVKAEMEKMHEQYAVFERRDVKCREDVKHGKQRTKKLQDTIKKENAKIEKEAENVVEQESTLASAEKDLQLYTNAHAKETAKLDAIYATLKDETEGLRVELEAKQSELCPWSKEVDECTSKLEVARSELSLLKEKEEATEKALAEAKANLEEAAATKVQRKEDGAAAEAKVKEATMKLKETEKSLVYLTAKEKERDAEVRTLRSKLEEAKSSSESSRSRGRVLELLMKESAAGRIRGVHGRLGDLGRIDSTYDIAISTACGALDHIVVDTAESGQKCVEFLRKTGAGRATFIMLEKITSLQERAARKVQTPEGVARLFDLVTPKKDEYSLAFYFALRDTLVANDLDQATRIAYNGKTRFRVVTLEGQLIDTSGTMAGGGNRVAKGGMSSSVVVSPKELAKMQKIFEDKSQELAGLRNKKAISEEDMLQLEKDVQEAKTEISKTKMDIESCDKQEKVLKQRIKELEASDEGLTEEEEKRVKSLTKEIAQLDKKVAAATAKASEIEACVHELQQKIMDVGGERLRSQKAKVEDMQTKIDDSMKLVAKTKVQMTTSGKNCEKAKKSIEKAEKELEEVSENLSKAKEELKALESEAMEVKDLVDESEREMARVEKSLESISKKYEDKKKALSKIKSVEFEITSSLEDHAVHIEENKKKVAHWGAKIEQVKAEKSELDAAFQEDEDVPAPATTLARAKPAVADEQAETHDETQNASEEEEQQTPSGDWVMGLEELTVEELEEFDEDAVNNLKFLITTKEDELAKCNPNMAAIEEYRCKNRELKVKIDELEHVTKERDHIRKEYDGLRKERLDMFMRGFSLITMKLKEMYQMITLGGDAELELVDSLDPFAEGIEFSVRPPNKSWKNISNLSGGEKTLSSLSLVFALHHFKPTPIYVMDEIDAALDFKNVSIVANYVKERTKNAQFIIISLRNNMFELADRLVGIYKTNNTTKTVTINPSSFQLNASTVA